MTRASARMSAARPGTRLSRGGWASDVRRLMSGVWRLASGVWRLASGVWRLASGVRRPASGVWRLAFGVWRLAFDIRILHLASCFRLPAHPDAADIGPRPPRRASPQYFGLLSIVSDCRRRSVSRKTVAIYSAIRLSIRATDL
ncbi:phosphotransferase enzyme family protein [Burkholderia pseudomallei 668]|nr:phosphotransferase enzyme family protein [Burkholderia pseudomallei 668]